MGLFFTIFGLNERSLSEHCGCWHMSAENYATQPAFCRFPCAQRRRVTIICMAEAWYETLLPMKEESIRVSILSVLERSWARVQNSCTTRQETRGSPPGLSGSTRVLCNFGALFHVAPGNTSLTIPLLSAGCSVWYWGSITAFWATMPVLFARTIKLSLFGRPHHFTFLVFASCSMLMAPLLVAVSFWNVWDEMGPTSPKTVPFLILVLFLGGVLFLF